MPNPEIGYPIVPREQINPLAEIEARLAKLTPAATSKVEARHEKPGKALTLIRNWWKGDAHTHTLTLPEFGHAEGIFDTGEFLAYDEKLGNEFACFTEHPSNPSAPVKLAEGSPAVVALTNHKLRIDKLNAEGKFKVKAYSGVESSIFYDKDGKLTLDVPDSLASSMDLVIASRHQIDKEKDPKAIKESLLFAVNHPAVAVLGHPDRYTRDDTFNNSKDPKAKAYWQEYWGIWPDVLDAMKQNNKAFEVNLNNPPSRKLLEMAAKAGVKFMINFDRHDFNQYKHEAATTKLSDKFKKDHPAISQRFEARQKDPKLVAHAEFVDAALGAEKHWVEAMAAKDTAEAAKVYTKEDNDIFAKYKQERLASGPGVMALLRLVHTLKQLEKLRVKPEQVINSSKDNFEEFVKSHKQTPAISKAT